MTSSAGPRPPRQRPVPLRTCVACRRERPKREMVRIVRTPDGEVLVDPTGKRSGRGAYLCPQRSCWNEALKRQRLGVALHTTLGPTVTQMLREYAQRFPEQEAAPAAAAVNTP